MCEENEPITIIASLRSVALEKPREFVNGEACLANQRPERTLGQFLVIWNRQAPVWRLHVPHYDMASVLFVELVSNFSKCANSVAAGYHRQFHRLVTSIT